MPIKKKKGSGVFMKTIGILGFVFVLLLCFQNCGDLSDGGLFGDSSSSSSGRGCENLECFRSSELLWLRIREYESYDIRFSDIENHFTVGGQCGFGGFSNHRFHWTLTANFGDETIVGKGFDDDLCNAGQFQVPIFFNLQSPQIDHSYRLTLKLVGINEDGAQIGNPSPDNEDDVNVIIIAD